MVKFNVTYNHVSWSPEFEDFLKAVGASEQFVKNVLAAKPSYTFLDAGDDKLTIVTKSGTYEKSVTFKFGETYEETGHDGAVSKNVTTRDGNVITTERTSASGVKTRIVSELTDTNLTQTVTNLDNGKSATVHYTKA